MRITVFAIVMAAVLLAGPAQARNPRFVSDVDFAPYSMISQGQPAGIDVDVINEAAKRAGLTLDLQFKPWDTLVQMVESGKCDGAFSFFHSPERERKLMFMEAVPVHHSDYVLFTKVGSSLVFNSYDDLKGKAIGTIAGTDLGKEFAEAAAQGMFSVQEYPDTPSALRGLLVGEISGYAGNIDVTYARLKNMGMTSSIVYLPKKILSQKPSYLVMSRASDLENKEEVIQLLERALDQMRKDGTYNKIARRYLLRY